MYGMVLFLSVWGLMACRTSQPDPQPAVEEPAAKVVLDEYEDGRIRRLSD